MTSVPNIEDTPGTLAFRTRTEEACARAALLTQTEPSSVEATAAAAECAELRNRRGPANGGAE